MIYSVNGVFFLILNFHSDFREQLFSDVSAKVPCNIATCKVICHSCCITKVEILVWKNFLNFDLKSIITLKHSSATETFEDLYFLCMLLMTRDAFTSTTEILSTKEPKKWYSVKKKVVSAIYYYWKYIKHLILIPYLSTVKGIENKMRWKYIR